MSDIEELNKRVLRLQQIFDNLTIRGEGWSGDSDDGFMFNPITVTTGDNRQFLWVNQSGLVVTCFLFNGLWVQLDEFTAGVSFQVNLNAANSWSIFLPAWQSGRIYPGSGCTGSPTFAGTFAGGASVTVSGGTYTVKSWSVVAGNNLYDFIGSGPSTGIPNTVSGVGGFSTITNAEVF